MDALFTAAFAARQNAHAPFSKFQVGAALECVDGRVFSGCNVESATYGLTCCAERTAAFAAIAAGVGVRSFRRIAIVTAAEVLTPPCGACRQVLWELCGDIEVLLGNTAGARRVFHLRELLPEPFDAQSLD